MKNQPPLTLLALRMAVALFTFIALNIHAEIHYVDVNSTNATPPYTNWATAATNIQDAVDAAVAGDEIVVTNGVYATGGRDGNRVKVDKPLSVRSVNGPGATTISGGVPCAYLTNGATLSGFTLTNGVATDRGGGVFCQSATAVVSNCVISGNFASADGGGAYGGTLNNCILTGNSSTGGFAGGGGAAYSTLNNCTLTGNSTGPGIGYGSGGGGAAYCTLNNCTLTGNSALSCLGCSLQYTDGGGAYQCILNNCALTDNGVIEMSGSGDAVFGGGAAYSTLNNCMAYLNYLASVSPAQTNSGPQADFYACVLNRSGTADPLFVDSASGNLRLQANSPCINAGNNSYVTSATDLDGNPRIVRGVVDIGAYEFQGGVHYVDVNSTNATPPYTNWTTAATNIQDAVDAAAAGDEIVVTNGIYATGGRTIDGVTTNRVLVDKPLSLRSVNGPQFTVIDGGGQVRCAYLTNSATLSGFTLTNGSGGVVGDFWTATATVSNCVISGNLSGGAFGCTLDSCTLSNNHAFWHGGGAWGCTLNNCRLIDNSVEPYSYGIQPEGGGAYLCTLNNCALSGNSVTRSLGYNGEAAFGGGASSCTLNNCTLTGNQVFGRDVSGRGFAVLAYGGGAYGSTLNNCTIVGNSASRNQPNNGHGIGGGAADCTLDNCIVSFNASILGSELYGSGLDHCWTTSDPLFVDTNGWANLRLQSNSPCINAGNNSYATSATDLDGNPRIAGGTVDIGAYEFQAPVSMISYAWLQQYGLPINPATDSADPDGDGVNNYHEWLAGTDPTNPFSSPAQLTIIPSGTNVLLTWPTNAVGFTLQSTTNLGAVWSTNSPAPVLIGGQNVVTNPIIGAQKFYRLVQ